MLVIQVFNVLGIVIGFVLFESCMGWLQAKAVPRLDGGLVPGWWVVAMLVRAAVLTAGSLAAAVVLPVLGVFISMVVFVIGLCAWPVGFLVDAARMELVDAAQAPRIPTPVPTGPPRLPSAIENYRNVDRTLEVDVRQCDDVAGRLRTRSTRREAASA